MSAAAVMEMLPNLTYSLPFFGEVNFQKAVAAAAVFCLLTFFFWLLRMVVLRQVKKLATKTKGEFDDVIVSSIENIRVWVYTIVALYASVQFFALPEIVERIFAGVFYFTVVWQVIEIISCFVDFMTSHYLEKDEDGDGIIDPNSATASNMVTLLARIVLWSLGTLLVLSNIGIEVTSLIAGLGIGGVAVAFALQGVLGDLFASFSLYFDKPFRIGDYIVIGSDSGTVEKIGIKTTRIRTLQGEELVVSNTELTTARVQNFKKMQERRVVANFGVTYETPQEKVHQIPDVVKQIFDALDGGRLDRVHFTAFGDSALIFEVVYYVESADYVDYLNIQQGFNFDLMKRFAEMSVDFAYPTQTIYTKSIS